MDDWMDERMHGWMDTPMDKRLDGWQIHWMIDEQRVNRWKNLWMHGYTQLLENGISLKYFFFKSIFCFHPDLQMTRIKLGTV